MTSKQKKQKKKQKQLKRQKKLNKPSFSLFRTLIVLGLWGMIIGGALVAWYATELPALIENSRFDHRAAITVKASDGSPITRYGETVGDSVTVDELPQHLIYAVMAIEDRRFYDHHGIDFIGLSRAMLTNVVKGRFVQGGSTITQQLAKNLFLSHERTIKRKIQEAILALWLERELTKDEILSAYFNRVYFGSGAYGVEAAAQTYFNKSATKLNLEESAMIAGLLKAPSRYAPNANPDRAKERAKIVLQAMNDSGYITEGKTKDSVDQMVIPTARNYSDTRSARYFSDYVTGQLSGLIGTPDTDLILETTLVPPIQREAQIILDRTLTEYGDRDVTQGAILVMDKSGAILAMVGGTSKIRSHFNRATQARRSPGSAFKPLIFLTALENGWLPADKILDAPIDDDEYSPRNFGDKYGGDMSLQDALAESKNTATVRLMKEVGVKNVIKTARKVGIDADLPRDLSLALGSAGIPMIEMVQAYATIANDGRFVTPYAVELIETGDGDLLYQNTLHSRGKQVIERPIASSMSSMLRNVIEYHDGTGKAARLNRPASGKTGTSQHSRDAWFIGYSDNIIAGVWLGNDDNSPMDRITGGSAPAIIWRDVMNVALNTKIVRNKYNRSKSSNRQAGSAAQRYDSFSDMLKGLFSD